MCTDSRYMNLYAADNNGYIYNWLIDGYALRKKETNPPKCKLNYFIIF
jgi:hypothetical protein